MKHFTILILTIIYIVGCKKEESLNHAVFIYKYKKLEYRKLSFVMLSENKTKIIGYPDNQDTLYYNSEEIENGYILDSGDIHFYNGKDHLVSQSCFGLQTGICSESRLDIMRNKKIVDGKTLIEKEPFVEFYYRDFDTFSKNQEILLHINDYIKNNELITKLHFKQIK